MPRLGGQRAAGVGRVRGRGILAVPEQRGRHPGVQLAARAGLELAGALDGLGQRRDGHGQRPRLARERVVKRQQHGLARRRREVGVDDERRCGREVAEARRGRAGRLRRASSLLGRERERGGVALARGGEVAGRAPRASAPRRSWRCAERQRRQPADGDRLGEGLGGARVASGGLGEAQDLALEGEAAAGERQRLAQPGERALAVAGARSSARTAASSSRRRTRAPASVRPARRWGTRSSSSSHESVRSAARASCPAATGARAASPRRATSPTRAAACAGSTSRARPYCSAAAVASPRRRASAPPRRARRSAKPRRSMPTRRRSSSASSAKRSPSSSRSASVATISSSSPKRPAISRHVSIARARSRVRSRASVAISTRSPRRGPGGRAGRSRRAGAGASDQRGPGARRRARGARAPRRAPRRRPHRA